MFKYGRSVWERVLPSSSYKFALVSDTSILINMAMVGETLESRSFNLTYYLLS